MKTTCEVEYFVEEINFTCCECQRFISIKGHEKLRKLVHQKIIKCECGEEWKLPPFYINHCMWKKARLMK
jgi:hypothetical protein